MVAPRTNARKVWFTTMISLATGYRLARLHSSRRFCMRLFLIASALMIVIVLLPSIKAKRQEAFAEGD